MNLNFGFQFTNHISRFRFNYVDYNAWLGPPYIMHCNLPILKSHNREKWEYWIGYKDNHKSGNRGRPWNETFYVIKCGKTSARCGSIDILKCLDESLSHPGTLKLLAFRRNRNTDKKKKGRPKKTTTYIHTKPERNPFACIRLIYSPFICTFSTKNSCTKGGGLCDKTFSSGANYTRSHRHFHSLISKRRSCLLLCHDTLGYILTSPSLRFRPTTVSQAMTDIIPSPGLNAALKTDNCKKKKEERNGLDKFKWLLSFGP